MGSTYVNEFQLHGRFSHENRLEQEKKIRKHVKYFFMGLFKNSKSRYYTRAGIPRNNRRFCFCIMTDDNEFYYFEKKMLSISLSSRSYKALKKIILTPFIYDENSDIIVDDSIKRHEPLYIILDILRSQLRFSISEKDIGSMYKMTAREVRLHPTWNLFGLKKQKILFKELKEMGYLNFVPDDFILSMSLKVAGQQQLMRDSIISMVYMYYRTGKREYHKKWLNRKENCVEKESNGKLDDTTTRENDNSTSHISV